MNKTLFAIMKRDKWSATDLSKKVGISSAAFRRMLRGHTNMTAEVYGSALDAMGYKILIVKKEDVV